MSHKTQKIHSLANYLWYRKSKLTTVILPISWLFILLAKLRRYWLQKKRHSLPKPVVVVGNISVGGTGKTPVVIALAVALRKKGYRPGIVSRGYKSRAPYYPFRVNQNTLVSFSGDEPLMIARETQCPVVVGPDRYAAALTLLAQFSECNIIISDDGLQHYGLPRDLEIAIIDGKRGFGNGYRLPAGPLREPINRLDSVDWIMINGESKAMNSQLKHYIASKQSESKTDQEIGKISNIVSVKMEPKCWLHIQSNTRYPLSPLPWSSNTQHRQKVGVKPKAVASIGNPQRFFSMLNELGLDTEPHVFSDHHHFVYDDLARWQQDVVLMTSKDAVKCQTFASDNWWALEIEAQLPPALIAAVDSLVMTKEKIMSVVRLEFDRMNQ